MLFLSWFYGKGGFFFACHCLAPKKGAFRERKTKRKMRRFIAIKWIKVGLLLKGSFFLL